MICASCGQAVASELRFCSMCGKRQSSQLDVPRVATSGSRSGQPLVALHALDTLVDWRRAFEILYAACRAVTEARARGVVQLALEPESLYLESPSGVVTILDADVQDLRDREQRDTEVRPALPGWLTMPRINYWAPERLMGKVLDGASDVYSLAVITFELITGRLPFSEANGPAGLLTAMHKQRHPVPSTLAPTAGIPRTADAVLLAGLDKDRTKRYADADQLAQAVSYVLGSEPFALSPVVRRPSPPPPARRPVAKPMPTVTVPTIVLIDGQRCGSPSCTAAHRFRAAPDQTPLGSWLYFDHFDSRVAARPEGTAHPHHGVVSIAYLFEGRMIHRDSLGTEQLVKASALSMLHAGRGAVHTEQHHPLDRTRGLRLHGLELWVALPRPNEDDPPAYTHHPAGELPSVVIGGARVRVLLGEGFGACSPVVTPMPLSLFDVRLSKGAVLPLPAPRHHEFQRAVYVVAGAVEIDGRIVETRQLAVISPQASAGITAARGAPAQIMLLGSAPLIGPRYTWWYFSTSSKTRIEEVKRRWSAGELGAVRGAVNVADMPKR